MTRMDLMGPRAALTYLMSFTQNKHLSTQCNNPGGDLWIRPPFLILDPLNRLPAMDVTAGLLAGSWSQ